MRVSKNPAVERFEGFVADCSSDLISIDLSATVDTGRVVQPQVEVPRAIFSSRTGVDVIPEGHALSVTVAIDMTAEVLEYGETVAAPNVYRGFIPLLDLVQLEAENV